jgi:hypothetical protein
MTMVRNLLLALIATVLGATAGRAQTQNVIIPPSLSLPMKQYYRDHPQEWQQLFSQIAKQQQAQRSSQPPVVPPAGGTWVLHNAPTFVGQLHLLTDGTVMAQQSCSGNWYKLTPDITGSYANGTWTPIAALPVINGTQYAPTWYAAEVLPDGRFIINGGEYNQCGPVVDTNMGAIYDPTANVWTAVSPPSGWANIGDAQSIVLADGTYMLANSQSLQQARLNIANMTWTATGSGKFDRNDEEGWTLLPNGKVLTVDASCGNNSEIYDPATGAWTSAGNTIVQLPDCSGNGSFELGPQVLRPDGTVVAFGGVTTGVNHTAIYNSSAGTWSQGPDIPSVCGGGTTPCTLADAPAALLPNGNILFAASTGNWPSRSSFTAGSHFFEVNFSNNTITQVADIANAANDPSYAIFFLVLPSGQVLAADNGNVQIYTPANQNFQAAWQPTVSSVVSCVNPGGTYSVFGTQLNGLSHGAAYGDDYQSNTNFPLVRIVNNGTGHVFYARTFNHSSRSVAPGNSGSTSFAVTAATETGPSTLYVVANGIPSVGTPITVMSGACPVPPLTDTHDFNADHMSDIAWRQSAGTAALWLMNGGQILQTGSFGVVATNWQIVGQRDFNGDGKHDLLWRDNNSGTVAMWLLNGLQVLQTANLGAVPSNWSIVGTSDFNGDNKGDLLWRDANTGAVGIWLMNGPQILQTGVVGTVPLNWTIVATDARGHIFWRDSNSGAVAIWTVSGFQVVQSGVPGSAALNWVIVGVGDFNGDGSTDILWRDSNTGTVAIWLMNGLQLGQLQSLGVVSSNWSVAVTGDFNGDTKSDICWRDANTGTVAVWFMNGFQVTSTANLGAVTTDWVIQGRNAE